MFTKRYKSHHDVSNLLSKYLRTEKATREDFLNILQKENPDKQLALYFHTPYCDKICSFCNMNRKRVDSELEDYHNYLCQQIEYYGNFSFCKSSELNVVFFGGGTPTIYSCQQLENILSTLHQNFHFASSYEMTFETTLHNLEIEKAKLLQKYGVNRISVGIQTFSSRGRKLLNRTFSKEEVISKLKELRDIFQGALCIDIIYNYPEQTEEEVLEDIHIAADIGIDGISFYSLMIQKGSEILKNFSDNSIDTFYGIERDEILHNLFYQESLKHGYHLLELTKITRGKDEYRYIWDTHNLLPIGVGAGGHIQEIGCYNMNQQMSFYSKTSEDFSYLNELSALFQFPSFSIQNLKKLSGESYLKIEEKLKEYVKEGWLQIEGDICSYTDRGVFWGNNINAAIMEVLLSDL